MRNSLKSLCSIGLLLLGLAGCGPNQGIEVGNPDLKGKVLTLTPQDRPETYLLDFADDGGVTATRILENQFEDVAASLEVEGNQSRIAATFVDGTFMEVLLTVDDAGKITDTRLFLNGQEVPLESSDLEPKSLNRPDFEEAAQDLAAGLCDRLVECGAESEVATCTDTLLDLPGLAPSLVAGASTLREMQNELESGELETEASALEACFWEMSQMPCPQVRKSNPSGQSHDGENLRKMIPRPSCSSGFRKTAN